MALMRVSAWTDLSDAQLKRHAQLGVDCVDLGSEFLFPSVKERGYPSLEEVTERKRNVESWGMQFNRVTLPALSERYMKDAEGGDRELENCVRALEIFGKAGVPIARVRCAGATNREATERFTVAHRGGYQARAERLVSGVQQPPLSEGELWWDRFAAAYRELIPVADRYGVKLASHPGDSPVPSAPLGGPGYHRIMDLFPAKTVGYLYCVGTRAEAGGGALVLDEINRYGRAGRILTVHFRNIRGSFATSSGFEEVLLDDGDMNMYRILLELKKLEFSGCLNPDHGPALEGDSDTISHSLAYSIGYIKALLAAVAC